MERLSDTTLGVISSWFRKAGMVLFIDADGRLKVYPSGQLRKRPKLENILRERHPEMKMFLIRDTKRGEE